MAKTFELTTEGLEELVKELENLIHVVRPQVLEDLNNAKAMGDLSENADYDAARNKQAEVEARIKELEYIKENCVVVEIKNSKSVNVSNIVKFKDLSDGNVCEVQIVSSFETNLFNEQVTKISNECLLGKALLGKKLGDKVTVQAKEPYEIEILDIKTKTLKNIKK